MLMCHDAYHIKDEITTSLLKNIARITANFDATCRGMLSNEVRKAAWKDTSLWLAMIHPRSRPGISLGGPMKVQTSRFQNPTADRLIRSENGFRLKLD